MTKSIAIVGAGGHARAVIPLLERTGFAIEGVYDNSYGGQKESILGYELKGSLENILETPLILAIGNNIEREAYYKKFTQVYSDNIFHPLAKHETKLEMGRANLVFANTYINAGVYIGDNNILNTGCIVEHECSVGSHCHVSIGSILGGRARIGNLCFIGAAAVVKDQISVCSNVIVGAGSVVVQDITECGTYVGNPARKVR